MMRGVISFLIVFMPFLLKGQPALNVPADHRQPQLNVSLALEPEVVLVANYTWGVTTEELPVNFRLGGGTKIPTTLFSNRAWRVHLTGSADWVHKNKLGVAANSFVYLVHNRNRAGEIYGLGFEIRANPGYYRPNWNWSLDLGWQNTFASYITHSEETRFTFEDRYPDGVEGIPGPRDGWYGATANRFRVGFLGARHFSEKVSFAVALGTLFATQRQGLLFSFDFAQLPVYLETTVRIGL